MFRRAPAIVARAPLASSIQVRSYIDHHHHRYAVYKPHAWGTVGYMLTWWMFVFQLGSVWQDRGWHHVDTWEFARRHHGKGYLWADEHEPTPLKSIWVNLPDSVE